MSQEVGQAASAWEELAVRLACPETVCPPEFRDVSDAVSYLRSVLGEDYLEGARKIRKHPFVGLLSISWPGLRSDFLNWVAHVRGVRQCQNVDRVIGDLRVANKCIHAYGMIEIGGRLRRSGLNVFFEPESGRNEFPFRPDARIDFPTTGESFFLELSCQWLAERQLGAFEAMGACHEPVRMHLETLKCSFRLRTIPAPDHMEEIVQRIEEAAQTVLLTGHHAEVVENGTLEMGICHRKNSEELDMWRTRHAIHFEGYEGPRDDTHEIDRLKQKIRREQRQLPQEYPNVLAIENDHIFSHYPDVRHLISALQEEVYKYRNLAFILVQGSNGSNRGEAGEVITQGEHRFQRSVGQGHVRHTLLLSNRYVEQKPSDKLRTLLAEALFD